MPICPNCSIAIPIRDGKPAKFCPHCGTSAEGSARTDTPTLPLVAPQVNARIDETKPATIVVKPNNVASTAAIEERSAPAQVTVAPTSPLRFEPTAITKSAAPISLPSPSQDRTPPAPRKWNTGAWLLNWVWLFAHRAYALGALYLLLGVLPLIPAAIFASTFLTDASARTRGDYSGFLAALLCVLIGGVLLLLLAIPLGIRGDSIALRRRGHTSSEEFAALQRTWARRGAGALCVSTLTLVAGSWYVYQLHTHGLMYMDYSLRVAASQGDTARIKDILDYNRREYGSYANLPLADAKANASTSDHPDVISILDTAEREQQAAKAAGKLLGGRP